MASKIKSRGWKWLIILLALLAIALVSLNSIATMYANKELEELIADHFNRKYQAHYEKLHVNVFTRSVYVGNILVETSSDPSRDSMRRLQFTAGWLELSGLDIYSLVCKRKVCINHVLIFQPNFSFTNWGSHGVDSTDKRRITLYDLLQPRFESLLIRRLQVREGSVKITGIDSQEFFMGCDAFNVEADNLVVDSATANTHSLFETGNTMFSLQKIHGVYRKGLYRMTIPLITLDTRNSVLGIDTVTLTPTVDENQFAKRLGYQKGCKNILLTDVKIHSGRWPWVTGKREVPIDSLVIGYAKITNYRDKNLPVKFVAHTLHHSFLSSLRFQLDLQRMRIVAADLEYTSLEKDASQPGHIEFNDVSMNLSTLSNMLPDDTMKLDISGAIMAQAKFKIRMILPLAKDEFYATATIGSYDMQIWNSMLRNFSPPLEIRSGHAQSTNLSMHANERAGAGTMTFLYSDLAVNVINKNEKGKAPGKNSIKTFVANHLIVVNDNPDKNTLRVGKIQYTRNPAKNFISYFWNLVFSGMKSSIGLNEEKMKVEISKDPT